MKQMREKRLERGTGPRRRTFALAVMVLGSIATLGVASPAMASLKQDAQRFADCPFGTHGVTECIYSLTSSGEFVIGNSTVPIVNPVTVQGGLVPPADTIAPAADGNTLSKSPQPVPGGLVGIDLPGNFTEVTATAELAGTGQLNQQGQLVLPLKTKLDNTLLGSGCYIGTEAEPLDLHLAYVTEPTTSIEDGSIITVVGTLSDTTFAAPGATGCTALPPVGDLAVNEKEGLPSAAGKNKAVMSGTTQEAPARIVKGALALPELGRCAKAEGVSEGKGPLTYHGVYTTSSCTEPRPEEAAGKYEWLPGPGTHPAFSGSGTVVTLETTGGTVVKCMKSSNAGEYTGTKTETVTYTLSGCAIGTKAKVPCQSSGASAGEVRTALLDGNLEFISENESPEKPVVGLDLKPASGTQLMSFECGGSPVTVSGSVISPITTLDKMGSSFKLKPTSSAGVQSPEAFEVGPKDTLTIASSSTGEVPAGLKATSTSTSEEKLEIKASVTF